MPALERLPTRQEVLDLLLTGRNTFAFEQEGAPGATIVWTGTLWYLRYPYGCIGTVIVTPNTDTDGVTVWCLNFRTGYYEPGPLSAYHAVYALNLDPLTGRPADG